MPLILTEPLWTFARRSSKGSLLLWGLSQPAFPVTLIDWEGSRTELYSCKADCSIWCYWQKIWVNQRQCRYFGKTWLAYFQILSWESLDLGGDPSRNGDFKLSFNALQLLNLINFLRSDKYVGSLIPEKSLIQRLELEATCNFLVLTSIKYGQIVLDHHP